MGRFMDQLFGAKREPWVSGGADQTVVSASEPGGADQDNEKTTLIEDAPLAAPSRAVTSTQPDAAVEPRQAAVEPRQASDAAAWQSAAPQQGRRISRPPGYEQRTPVPGSLGTTTTLPGTAAPPFPRSSSQASGPQVPPSEPKLPPSMPMAPDFRLTPSRGWLVMLALIAIAVAAGVVIALNIG
jgi:hypothetical protein